MHRTLFYMWAGLSEACELIESVSKTIPLKISRHSPVIINHRLTVIKVESGASTLGSILEKKQYASELGGRSWVQ